MGDSYRPSRSDRDGPPPALSDRISFRGGGGRSYADSYRPELDAPQRRQDDNRSHAHEFTFSAGPSNLQFAPTAPANSTSRRGRGRGGSSYPPPRDSDRRYSGNPQSGRRGANGYSRGGNRFFRQPAPHERPLLQSHDGEDNERVLGVAEGSNKFRSTDDMSDEEEIRYKIARGPSSIRADGSSVPQWSNPDPYTSAPPVDEKTGVKIDLVKWIQSKKNEDAEQAEAHNAVAANDDYISFGSLNDLGAPRGPANPLLAAQWSVEAAGLPQRPQQSGRPSKRKHAEPDREIIEEWLPDEDLHPAPWVIKRNYSHLIHTPISRLHNEILDFHEFVEPTDKDAEVRKSLVQRLQSALGNSRFPGQSSCLHCFGSYPAGLYLPTADMDLVYASNRHHAGGPPSIDFGDQRQVIRTLREAANALKHRGIAQNITCIHKAKVPIIKFVDQLTGIPVDISFENLSGVKAQSTFRRWKTEFPDLPPLVSLVKQFLVMRGLNEVHNGGLGGFTVICLVVTIIHLRSDKASLGDLFLDFLDFYGNKFDLASQRIIMKHPYIVDKGAYSIDGRAEKPTQLSIQDPNKSDNNISGGSHRAAYVFKIFSQAHKTLTDQMDILYDSGDGESSALQSIIGGNYDTYEKHWRRMEKVE
ncbi:hypothetical protein BDV95DRAFT_244021 [Massariosphaeria phaeospora]|uniref:polynucleotide adenylyltransferase n=1 Tax=Massariosphaeria phaeospora TaxID=100035 RepID=A0A7C8HZ95_9PLEO|nr:hypothetical protein BDV95DRAFT_244021 [Massariosphaeria phaeospora]